VRRVLLRLAVSRRRRIGRAGERQALPRPSPVGLLGLVLAAVAACGEPVADAPAAPLRVEAVPREPAGEPLWAPVGLARSPDEVWVLDAGAGLIHAYDFAGRHRRTAGRKGRGPGELLDPLAVGVTGDSLWVLNTGNRRVEWFGLDGLPRGSTPIADSVPPLVDLVRFEGRWYGTSPFGRAPVLRLVERSGALDVEVGLGRELAERVPAPADGERVDEVYRLSVARDRLWALHAYLPLAAAFEGAGRDVQGGDVRVVEVPGPVVGAGELRERSEGERVRRVRSAPREAAGSLGVLESDGGLFLLSRQRDARGRQRLFRIDDEGGPPRTFLGPAGVLLVSSVRLGGRAFAIGTRGEADEPALFLVDPAAPGTDPPEREAPR